VIVAVMRKMITMLNAMVRDKVVAAARSGERHTAQWPLPLHLVWAKARLQSCPACTNRYAIDQQQLRNMTCRSRRLSRRRRVYQVKVARASVSEKARLFPA